MLPRQPLRFLLADDPGAGKTWPAMKQSRRRSRSLSRSRHSPWQSRWLRRTSWLPDQ